MNEVNKTVDGYTGRRTIEDHPDKIPGEKRLL